MELEDHVVGSYVVSPTLSVVWMNGGMMKENSSCVNVPCSYQQNVNGATFTIRSRSLNSAVYWYILYPPHGLISYHPSVIAHSGPRRTLRRYSNRCLVLSTFPTCQNSADFVVCYHFCDLWRRICIPEMGECASEGVLGFQ
jgi:hypothetical protein